MRIENVKLSEIIRTLTLTKHQGWDLLHRIDLLVFLRVLLSPISELTCFRIKSGWDNLLEDVYGLHVHLHPGDVEGDPHPPGARGPVVGVELRLLSNIII